MVSMADIQDVGRRIGREFHPRRVVLFGSHARKAADSGSDVDLLVVMPFRGSSVAKAVEIRLKIDPPFPVDLLVRSPAQVRRRLALGDAFLGDILRRGKVLYEDPDR